MTNYDDIFEIAADGYGLVTAAQARDAGITTGEMSRWCASGRLLHRGYGVYKLARWVPTPYDAFAEAVALVGEDGFLWGEAVLSMHGLGLVDPPVITVATFRRVRRKLPAWVRLVSVPKGVRYTFYEGIPSQCVADAIRVCRESVMSERLRDAVEQARTEGLVTAGEYEGLREELT